MVHALPCGNFDHAPFGTAFGGGSRSIAAACGSRPTRELAETQELHKTTAIDRLHALGTVSEHQRPVPHDPSENDRRRRAEAAASLPSRRRTDARRDSVVTGDEKRCLYVDAKRRRTRTKENEPSRPRSKLQGAGWAMGWPRVTSPPRPEGARRFTRSRNSSPSAKYGLR